MEKRTGPFSNIGEISVPPLKKRKHHTDRNLMKPSFKRGETKYLLHWKEVEMIFKNSSTATTPRDSFWQSLQAVQARKRRQV